jgi:biopolymer transport protein ExbD
MASVDVPETGGGKKGKKKKRRIAIRLDMTPMVDIAFLLLIFYMVTTVFAAPQAMDINLPKEEADTATTMDVAKSNLCVVRVDSNDVFWFTIGDEKGASRPVKHENIFDSLLVHNNNNYFLSTLVKIHPKAKFNNYVDILDDFAKVEGVLKSDSAFLADYLAENKRVLKSFADTTYSYRYTTTSWNNRKDTRMLGFALDSMRARGERLP